MSARVSLTQADFVAAGGGLRVFDGGSSEAGIEADKDDEDAEEGEPVEIWSSPTLTLIDDEETMDSGRFESERGVTVQKSRGFRCYASTLFVDGIAEAIGYHHIRSLFTFFEKISRVFVQRNRKLGRNFRFGFVSFLSREQASSAVVALDGLRVCGSTLTVAPARYPRAEPPSHVFQAAHASFLWGLGSSGIREMGYDVIEMELGMDRGGDMEDQVLVEFLFPEISPQSMGVVGEVIPVGLGQLGGDGMGMEEDDVEAVVLGFSCREELMLRPSVPSPSPIMVAASTRPRKAYSKGIKEKGQPERCPPTTSTDSCDLMSSGKESMVLSEELSNPNGIMTRARRALLMGKCLGMTYDCTDDVAQHEIAAQIFARSPE